MERVRRAAARSLPQAPRQSSQLQAQKPVGAGGVLLPHVTLCSSPGSEGPGPRVLGSGDACSSLSGVHPVGKLPGFLAPGQGLGRHLLFSQGRGKHAVQADGPPSPIILLFLLPGWGAGPGRAGGER